MEVKTEKRPKSVAMKRQIACYPPQKYHTLFVGYLQVNEMKKSEGATEIIRQFFDKMPENKKAQYLNEGIRVTRSKHSY